ncbi:TPA_asm: protein 4 [Cupressus virus 1]|uniref:Protein 4 n=1 Tax=Cupressus virus 1 TaxID=2977965 RepID=A0A9N7AB29_9RHAB|nr:TPA_asm: protein 4 [Cupressus virus 1]
MDNNHIWTRSVIIGGISEPFTLIRVLVKPLRAQLLTEVDPSFDERTIFIIDNALSLLCIKSADQCDECGRTGTFSNTTEINQSHVNMMEEESVANNLFDLHPSQTNEIITAEDQGTLTILNLEETELNHNGTLFNEDCMRALRILDRYKIKRLMRLKNNIKVCHECILSILVWDYDCLLDVDDVDFW